MEATKGRIFSVRDRSVYPAAVGGEREGRGVAADSPTPIKKSGARHDDNCHHKTKRFYFNFLKMGTVLQGSPNIMLEAIGLRRFVTSTYIATGTLTLLHPLITTLPSL